MKINIYFLIISRSFLLRIRNVSEQIVDKITLHILCLVTFDFFFRKSSFLRDNVEKYSRTGQDKDYIIAHAHCMMDT